MFSGDATKRGPREDSYADLRIDQDEVTVIDESKMNLLKTMRKKQQLQ